MVKNPSVAYWYHDILNTIYDIRRGWTSCARLALVDVGEDCLPVLGIRDVGKELKWAGIENETWCFDYFKSKQDGALLVPYKRADLFNQTRITLPDNSSEVAQSNELVEIIKNGFPSWGISIDVKDIHRIEVTVLDMEQKSKGKYVLNSRRLDNTTDIFWNMYEYNDFYGKQQHPYYSDYLKLWDEYVSSFIYLWNEWIVLDQKVAAEVSLDLSRYADRNSELIRCGICEEYSWAEVHTIHGDFLFIYKPEGLELRKVSDKKRNVISIGCMIGYGNMNRIVCACLKMGGNVFDLSFPSLEKPKFEYKFKLNRYHMPNRDISPFRTCITSPYPWVYSSWEPEPDDPDLWMYDEEGHYIEDHSTYGDESWDDMDSDDGIEDLPEMGGEADSSDEFEDITSDFMEDLSDSDEEPVEDGKFSGLNLDPTQDAIVPDGITQIRLVGLKFNSKIVAYRFKTNKGEFDITMDAATKAGHGGIRVLTAIQLMPMNGLLLTASEKTKKVCIPDVSNCEQDVNKLFNLLFTLQS